MIIWADRASDSAPPAPAVFPVHCPLGQPLEGRAGAISLAPDQGDEVRITVA